MPGNKKTAAQLMEEFQRQKALREAEEANLRAQIEAAEREEREAEERRKEEERAREEARLKEEAEKKEREEAEKRRKEAARKRKEEEKRKREEAQKQEEAEGQGVSAAKVDKGKGRATESVEAEPSRPAKRPRVESPIEGEAGGSRAASSQAVESIVVEDGSGEDEPISRVKMGGVNRCARCIKEGKTCRPVPEAPGKK
jgi:hypothetical protein